MKKILGLFMVLALFFVSCASQPKVDYAYPQSGTINDAAPIPMKDYQTLGIIFVESTEIIDGNGNHYGSKITNAMLMREAAKLGADDIINLRIDVQEIHELIPGNELISGIGMVSQITYKYTATALAIKYTDVIISAGGMTNLPRHNDVPVFAELQTQHTTQQQSQSAHPRKMYLGGFLGGGWASWEDYYTTSGTFFTHHHYSEGTEGLGVGGIVFNFIPLRIGLSDAIAFRLGAEVSVGVAFEFGGDGVYPVIPLMASIGMDFGPVGISFNAGYAVLMGLVLSPTIDFNMGAGKLYVQYLTVPSVNPDVTGRTDTSSHMFTAGYKVGLGR